MLDNDAGDEWIEAEPFKYEALHEMGYSVGGFVDDDGSIKYVLYRRTKRDRDMFERVHAFDSREELLLAVKLLVPGGI
jgi:hypothetical protein